MICNIEISLNRVITHDEQHRTLLTYSTHIHYGHGCTNTLYIRIFKQVIYLSAVLNSQLGGLSSRVSNLEAQQDDTTSQINGLSAGISDLNLKMSSLSQGFDKLVATNLIWKTNFKNVDKVFGLLKKRFNLKMY